MHAQRYPTFGSKAWVSGYRHQLISAHIQQQQQEHRESPPTSVLLAEYEKDQSSPLHYIAASVSAA